MAHLHCDSCVLSNCSSRRDGCPVERCPNGCGVSLHRCKIDEHVEHTCLEARVPCVNAQYGCEEVLKRGSIVSHIEHCSASTVLCRFTHERVSTNFLGPHPAPGENMEEALLDEKFLLGDLKVLDQSRVVKCNEDFTYGVLSYGSSPLERTASDPNRPASDTDLSVQCKVGVLTNASVYSGYHIRSLKLRQRVCVDMHAQLGYSIQYSYGKKPTKIRHYYAFPCNEVVRRDEFSTHWKCFHLDVEEDMDRIVERCPMYLYGCMHGEVRLVPNPKGSSIDYNEENDLFLIKPPEIINTKAQPQASGSYAAKLQVQQELALYGYGDESEESLDVLGQLPAEILMKICEFLDSMSLWNLSQVNHYIRKVCLSMAKRKGIVYQAWVVDEATKRWVFGPKRWSFSRVFSTIPFWSYTDAPAMGSHLMSCDHYRSNVVPYDPSARWKLLDLPPDKLKKITSRQ